jgi:hypothetical protein
MTNDLTALDASALQQLYDNEVAVLHEKLLTGTPWDELSNHRKRVTEISIALNKKHTVRTNNPAEVPEVSECGRDKDVVAP